MSILKYFNFVFGNDGDVMVWIHVLCRFITRVLDWNEYSYKSTIGGEGGE